MCTDPDGAPCFPLYGLAPHVHKPDRIEFDLTPVAGFTPDSDDPTNGVHWCPHCGDGRPETDAPKPAQHSDDLAVDRFAAAMKQKLGIARTKGRAGWQTCSKEDLSRMLREHIEKGDPRDVANFCMFLWSLGHGIAQAEQPDSQITG